MVLNNFSAQENTTIKAGERKETRVPEDTSHSSRDRDNRDS